MKKVLFKIDFFAMISIYFLSFSDDVPFKILFIILIFSFCIENIMWYLVYLVAYDYSNRSFVQDLSVRSKRFIRDDKNRRWHWRSSALLGHKCFWKSIENRVMMYWACYYYILFLLSFWSIWSLLPPSIGKLMSRPWSHLLISLYQF